MVHGVETDTLVSIENLSGSNRDDTIVGDANANVIIGLAGNDILTGAAGADVFEYRLGGTSTGSDTITDFAICEDQIRVLGSSANTLVDMNPLQAGADTVLDLGAGSIVTLENPLLSASSDSDFIF